MSVLKIPTIPLVLKDPCNEIIRIEALSSYSRIYLANGNQLVVAKVLLSFQLLLPEEVFVRVHQSHLINKLFVAKIGGNHNKFLTLRNGERIPISRRKKDGSMRLLVSQD